MSNIISKRLANIIGTASTIPNFIGTNISTSTLNTGNLTTGNINFTGTIYQNGIAYVGSQWTTTQGSNLSYTSGSVVIETMLSVGSLRSTESSTGTLNAGNLTTGNINFTGILSQNGVAYVGSQWTSTQGSSLSYTSGTVVIETMLSAGNAFVTNLTTANILYNNLTVSNLVTNNVNLGVISLYSGSMIAANNVPSPTSVTGLLFNSANVRYMEVKVTVTVILSVGDPLIQAYTLFCYYNTAWSLLSDSIGDTTTVVFSIDSSTGQVYYTSTNISNWTSTTIRYAVQQFTSTGTYTSLLGNTVGSYILDSIQLNSTTNSILGTSNGAIYVLGGATIGKSVNIQATNVATAVGSGGSLTVFGGMAVSGNVIINSGANSSFNSNTLGNLYTTGGNIGIGNPNPSYSLDISGDIRANNGTFGGHLVPSSNITYDLGSTTNRWRDLYLSGSSINLGGTLISVTAGGTQIAFGSSVIATTTTGNIASSIENLIGSTGSIGNVYFVNISAGTLNAGNLTTGNINFTGILSQNGTAYVGSQWTSTQGSSLSYTSGSVVIETTLSAGTLISTTSTIGNIVHTNTSSGTYSGSTATIGNIVATTGISTGNIVATTGISTGTYSGSTATIGNIVHTNTSSGTYSGTTATIGNIVATTGISTGTYSGSTATIGNIVAITGITTGNIVSTTGISTGTYSGSTATIGNIVNTNTSSGTYSGSTATIGNIVATTGISTGTYSGSTATIGNIVNTNTSSGTYSGSTATIGNIVATTGISTGTYSGSTATIGNIVATTGISTGTYSGSLATIGNIVASTGISSGTYVGTSVSVGNISVVNFSTSNLQISGNISGASSVATIGTLRSSDIFVSGTLTSVNITTQNLLQSNGTLIANNITTGGIFVSTGGLISITVSSGTIFGSSSTIGNIVALTGISSGSYVGNSVTVSGVVNASTSTVPNVVHTNVTTSTLIAGGKLTGVGGTLLNNIQNSISGTSSFGLGFWSDSNWAIYMGQSGGTRSFSNGAACNGVSFLDFALRFRAFNSASMGFIFENSNEQTLMSIRGSDGFITAPGGISTGSIHATSSTISNMVHTNISTGALSVSNTISAIGNSNTIGNLFTTGGNTFIGLTSTKGSLLIYNSINTTGNMLNANTVGNVITTDIRVMNKRIRTSRANANNTVSAWATRTFTTTGFWPVITWSPELNLFVAGNNAVTSSCQTSPDGINWTARTLANSTAAWDCCWSSELSIFILTGNNSSTQPIQSSTNGTTWTSMTAGTAYAATGACWSAELGIFVVAIGANGVLTSSNGTTWAASTLSSPTPGGGQQRVVWSAELGIFLLTNQAVGFYYSSNGTSWTSVAYTAIGTLLGLSWSPELYLFVASGTTGGGIATSPDGINWTARSAAGVTSGTSVTWSPELSIFIAVNGANIRSSSDGILWTSRASGLQTMYNSCWCPELSMFLVPSNNNVNSIYTSNIGIPNSESTLLVNPAQMANSNGNLIVSGDITAFGTLSDSRLKTNVVTISETIALNVVKSLRPVTFNWKDDIFNKDYQGKDDSGFIAQEVEQILSHAVSEYHTLNTDTIYKNMKHERIIPYLVSVIQNLEKRIDILENK